MAEEDIARVVRLHERFRHLDLKEIAGRFDRDVSVRGTTYSETEPGKQAGAILVAVAAIKTLLADGVAQPWRLEQLLQDRRPPWAEPRIPAALKRLSKLKQITIKSDGEGALISLGSAWIEPAERIAFSDPDEGLTEAATGDTRSPASFA